MEKEKNCRNCIYAYQRECIGLVMCPQWEMADGDNVAETCPDYKEDSKGYIKGLFEEEKGD